MMAVDGDLPATTQAARWRYLACGEELIFLLKRGVIAVPEARSWSLAWHQQQATEDAAAVSEDDFQSYLQRAYENLPPSVASLLTLEQFQAQAESKRAEIESQLAQQRQVKTAQQLGQLEDWLMQRFFCRADNALAWMQHPAGLQAVWLALDPAAWPQAELQPVVYQTQATRLYPPTLLVDPPEYQTLGEYRLLLNRHQQDKCVTVAGVDNALVRIPPKAIRALVLGSDVTEAAKQTLLDFWRSDFRYQRTPVQQMQWRAGFTQPSFVAVAR
ncbi:hypothetical protein CHH28_04710 [Bacterioplanes sanyensis]|uniref:Uncharacterized protein n=1 Tax=Bacterioplanes sanyensis TaxID=1249553 RepID=A0A222FIH7_9GAMM|nr:hypothetical protein [Bacterioplanes sanyensis]ASP38023.1 hypothetical protein CHH28_04710 [Bacterioplanes sanyensis]